MTEPTAPAEKPRSPGYPTRFSWPMRLFLGFLFFDMIFRAFSTMYPWQTWGEELEMRMRPIRMPTRAEISQPRSSDNPDTVTEDFFKAFDSTWDFFRPWPEPAARARIHGAQDAGKWLTVWIVSRLEFVENVLAINHEWPMFSPSVGKRKRVARAVLVYADGTERTIRGKCDPANLLCYYHWNEEKVLDHELKVKADKGWSTESFGYCNLLAHRYPRNEAGADLKEIRLFTVYYELPPPGVDIHAWLSEQTGPPEKQVEPVFYIYDAKARDGKFIPPADKK